MEKGDRVKLVERVARSFRDHRGKKKIDWVDRRGTIASVGHSGQIITIKWDDRRTMDQWPVRAVEVLRDPGG